MAGVNFLVWRRRPLRDTGRSQAKVPFFATYDNSSVPVMALLRPTVG